MKRSSNGNNFKNWAPAQYRIKVAGILGENWSERLGGMAIRPKFYKDRSKITELIGWMRDQTQLAGVLNSLYELHLPIISVERIPESKNE
jgi:hypothetical protein